jgi:hypothetical protein
MPTLIAITELRHGGVQYKPGERFEASPQHARVWMAVRKASLATDDETGTTHAGKSDLKGKGTYKTRDLKAK